MMAKPTRWRPCPCRCGTVVEAENTTTGVWLTSAPIVEIPESHCSPSMHQSATATGSSDPRNGSFLSGLGEQARLSGLVVEADEPAAYHKAEKTLPMFEPINDDIFHQNY